MAWVVPPTFTGGQTAGVSTGLNQMSGDLAIIGGARTTYTPTTTGITLGNGSVAGRYRQIDKEVEFQIIFTFGSTSSITATPTFTLPATAHDVNWEARGTAMDTSASLWFPAPAVATSTTVLTAFALNSVAGSNYQGVTSTRPMTWATGDVLTISGHYEAA